MSKNISRIALVLAMLVVMPSAILAQKQKLQAVDLGLSVKWASHNMGANNPENIGTSLQQCYAFNNFNKNNVKFDLLSEWPKEEYFSFLEGIDKKLSHN